MEADVGLAREGHSSDYSASAVLILAYETLLGRDFGGVLRRRAWSRPCAPLTAGAVLIIALPRALGRLVGLEGELRGLVRVRYARGYRGESTIRSAASTAPAGSRK
jgi:hypothetical protein